MTVLIIAEHDNHSLKPSTFPTVTAALQLGETTVLVAGSNCGRVAEEASKLNGIKQVLHADASHLEHPLSEEWAPLIASLKDQYSFILAPAGTFGCNHHRWLAYP